MPTSKVLRGILVIASPEVGETARLEIAAAGPLRVKAVTGARAALAAISDIKPCALLVENGAAPMQAVQAVRNLAELTMSRHVPVVMMGGPLDPGIEAQREAYGIAEVIDGPYRLEPAIDALRAAIGKVARMSRSSKIRRRLRAASDSLKPLSDDDVKRIRGEQRGQDFADDDVAPGDKSESPTWDGSDFGRRE